MPLFLFGCENLSPFIFPGATPYSSFRLHQRKFLPVLKKNSFHPFTVRHIFLFIARGSPHVLGGWGGQQSRPGNGWACSSGGFPWDYLQISFLEYTPKLFNHQSSILSEVNCIQVCSLLPGLVWKVLAYRNGCDWNSCPLSPCHTQSVHSQLRGNQSPRANWSILLPFHVLPCLFCQRRYRTECGKPPCV